MDGFLNLAKPPHCTSRDVVNQVQRLVRPVKVGHAGTLDPLAEGVLVVAVGQATKLIERVQSSTKTYAGTFLLGRHSDTEDIEGEVIELDGAETPGELELQAACAAMVGQIEQMPPQFSALKVAGKRAYQLARKGVKAELKARTIRIDECALVSYEYPRFELRVRCGSGTYIRSLGRDIATRLGTAAVMSALTRTAVGEFRLENAVAPSALNGKNLAAHLAPLSSAVANLPRLQLAESEVSTLSKGQLIDERQFGQPTDWTLAAAFAPDGLLAALVAPAANQRIRAARNFPRTAN